MMELINFVYILQGAILNMLLGLILTPEINYIRHIIKMLFVNKGIEFMDLPSIFKDKSVISSVSTYFENKKYLLFVISAIQVFIVLYLIITN